MQACAECLQYHLCLLSQVHAGQLFTTVPSAWVLCLQSGLALISWLKKSDSCVHSTSFPVSSSFSAKSIHLYAADLARSVQRGSFSDFCASHQITQYTVETWEAKWSTDRIPGGHKGLRTWMSTHYPPNLLTFLAFSPISLISSRLLTHSSQSPCRDRKSKNSGGGRRIKNSSPAWATWREPA